MVSKVTVSVVLTGTDAQTVRPYNRYSSRFDTTDAPIVRPYSGLLVSSDDFK